MKTIHLHTVILARFANIARDFLRSRCLRNLLPILFIIVASISNTAAQDGYFYVSHVGTSGFSVYDQNLVSQNFVQTGPHSNSRGTGGLEILPNGNLVVAEWGPDARVIIYDPSGTVVSTFAHPTSGSAEVKGGPSDLLYIGDGANGVMEFTTSGTLLRTFPTLGNRAVAVLPGNVLWAAGLDLPGAIDVFDLVTGNKTSTITLDNGQPGVTAMSYSPSTGTVLMSGDWFGVNAGYERTLSGAFVRSFPGGLCTFGITRGPNGDVLCPAVFLEEIDGDYIVVRAFQRWSANGEFLGRTDLWEGDDPGNIVWVPGLSTNNAPVLTGVPSSTIIDEGEAYSFTAAATDPDGDTLRFSMVSGGLGASIDPVTGVFTWTPSEVGGNTYGFDVWVVDDDFLHPLADRRSIQITVRKANSPPVLGVISDSVGDIRSNISFTATATDADIPANALTFSLIGAPAGASINPSSGVFSWIPTNGQTGKYTFTVRVSDNGAPVMTDDQSVTVTVSRVRGR